MTRRNLFSVLLFAAAVALAEIVAPSKRRPRATAINLRTGQMVMGPLHGEPLNLTDEQRARLPKLEPRGDGIIPEFFRPSRFILL